MMFDCRSTFEAGLYFFQISWAHFAFRQKLGSTHVPIMKWLINKSYVLIILQGVRK